MSADLGTPTFQPSTWQLGGFLLMTQAEAEREDEESLLDIGQLH